MKQFKIEIPTPCHEDWEKMTPESKGRFCGSCEKIVIDFTGMSAQEIAETLKKQKNVCGRVTESQLQKTYFYPNKEYRFFPYTSIAAGLLLFLSPLTLVAQPASQKTEIIERKYVGELAVVEKTTYDLEITVVDKEKTPIANFDLTIYLDDKGNKISSQTSDKGIASFRIDRKTHPLELLQKSGVIQFDDEKLPISVLQIEEYKSTLIIETRKKEQSTENYMLGKFYIRE